MADIEHPATVLRIVAVDLEDLVIDCLDPVVGAVGMAIRLPPAGASFQWPITRTQYVTPRQVKATGFPSRAVWTATGWL